MPTTDSLPDLGGIRFRKIRDAGGVLNAVFAFTRRNARELLLGYAALVVPVALAAGVALGIYIARMTGWVADLETDPGAINDVADFGWSYAAVLVFSTVTAAVAQAAVGGFVRLYRQGEAGEITLGRLWAESQGFVLPLIGMSFVFGLVVMLSAVVSRVPCLGALAWLGFVIWLVPYYGVAVAARMVDAPSVGAAWQRARVLVKGSWGAAAGPLLLLAVVAFVMLLALYFVISAVMGAALMNTASDDPSEMMRRMGWLFAPLQAITYVVYLVPMLGLFFIHGRLVEELEGSTLHDDLDVLAGSVFAHALPPEEARSTPPPPPDAAPPDDEAGDAPEGGFRGGGFGA